MTSDWSYYRLGDLIDVKHGWSFKGEFFRDEPTRYLLLTPGNFCIGGGFQLTRPKYYDGAFPEEFALSPGDLIITMTDLSKESDTLGYPALVPEIPDLTCLHNQRIGKVTIRDSTKLDLRYLYYVCCSREYRDEILASASGTGVKHTAPERIKGFGTYLPSVEEQFAIVRILRSLDDKIELNRKIEHTLESIAGALFRAWFVDFDPAVAKSEGRRLYGMNAETAALVPVVSQETGDKDFPSIPAGWQLKSLLETADYVNGLALQKYRPEGAEYLSVIKIRELRQGYPDQHSEHASPSIKASAIIDDGDVVFSWSGSLMIDIWCGGRGALNQHLFKVTSEAYPKWFYYFWTKYHLTEFQNIAEGKATTMGHIQRHHLEAARVLVPAKPLLEKASDLFQPMIELIVKSRVQSRYLAATRGALLPKLLSGDIRLTST